MLTPLETEKAHQTLKQIISATPLMLNFNVSDEHHCNVFLKREDLQPVRSYKIRGAYNKITSLTTAQRLQGVVCASAGNHAQGVAYSCYLLKIKGVIYMPTTTPSQKVEQVRMFGKEFIEIRLVGDTFDDSKMAAQTYCSSNNMIFIHPFDDLKVIEGQSTVALEILNQMTQPIDYLFLPVGGGGLAAGVSYYLKKYSPQTKIIAVEPLGAPSLKLALERGKPVKLDQINKFVDGAAVQEVGDLTFEYCKEGIDDVVLVDEGKVCSTILKLYNKDAVVVEPAGALSLAALDYYQDKIKGKNVVCIVSGSNNDITRMEEIKERSLLYEGLKHYFLVDFPQRSGALKEFVNEVLGPTDDITHFEYVKRNNREKGPIRMGIEVKNKADFELICSKMKSLQYRYQYLNSEPEMVQLFF
jgi:threonine dehydratase